MNITGNLLNRKKKFYLKTNIKTTEFNIITFKD